MNDMTRNRYLGKNTSKIISGDAYRMKMISLMFGYELCFAYKSSQQQKNVFVTATFNNVFKIKIRHNALIVMKMIALFLQKKYIKTKHY